jgi:hypothetical protein
MDPITRASRQLLAALDASWRTHSRRVVPIISEWSYRSDVIKTLKLLELSPDNRRPLFVYEAPFVAVGAYCDGLVAAIQTDYEALRRGVSAEGVLLPSFFQRGELLAPMERAVLAMEWAAVLLGERFEGVMVALVPKHVDDGHRWREWFDRLIHARFSLHVRVAVFTTPDGPLEGIGGGHAVRFIVDQNELTAFLKQLGTGSHGENLAESTPCTLPNESRCSMEIAAELRMLLLEGAQATGAGQHGLATKCYGEARTLCETEGLVLEQALVLMVLGGACLAAEAADAAIESYRKAASLARAKAAWQVECQAWLGVGGACLRRQYHEAAARAYHGAATAASQGHLALLESEALRMAELCSRLDGTRKRNIACA